MDALHCAGARRHRQRHRRRDPGPAGCSRDREPLRLRRVLHDHRRGLRSQQAVAEQYADHRRAALPAHHAATAILFSARRADAGLRPRRGLAAARPPHDTDPREHQPLLGGAFGSAAGLHGSCLSHVDLALCRAVGPRAKTSRLGPSRRGAPRRRSRRPALRMSRKSGRRFSDKDMRKVKRREPRT